jgi:hypothetical protein
MRITAISGIARRGVRSGGSGGQPGCRRGLCLRRASVTSAAGSSCLERVTSAFAVTPISSRVAGQKSGSCTTIANTADSGECGSRSSRSAASSARARTDAASSFAPVRLGTSATCPEAPVIRSTPAATGRRRGSGANGRGSGERLALGGQGAGCGLLLLLLQVPLLGNVVVKP